MPGLGKRTLTNVLVRVPGRSPRVIVVLAHRDEIGFGGGVVDNASGTAALVELARAYAQPATAGAPTGRVRPAHTLLFVSTDGGAYGAVGAAHLAQDPAYRDRIAAVVALDSLGGNARPRLAIDSDRPITASPVLVRTAAERVLEETGEPPIRESVIKQLRSLAFPYSLSEQAPFVSRGVAAVTLTTAAEQRRDPTLDTSETLNVERLGQLGSAAQQLLLSLDQGIEPGPSTTGYLYLGDRILRGWAIQLVLAAMTLPFLAAAVDLFARTRRRRIPLAPALRALRTRLLFWLSVGAVFVLLDLIGAWPDGSGRPLSPDVETGRTWPVLRPRGPRPGLVRGLGARALPARPEAAGNGHGGARRAHGGAARARPAHAARGRDERVRADLPPPGPPRLALAAAAPRPRPADTRPRARGRFRGTDPARPLVRDLARPRLRRALVPRRARDRGLRPGHARAAPARHGRLRRPAHRPRGRTLRAVSRRGGARPPRSLPRARAPDRPGRPRPTLRTQDDATAVGG